MIVWMIYAMLVGILVTLGALAAERVARTLRVATRWVWVAAIALAIGLAMRAPSVDAGFDVPTFGYATNDSLTVRAPRTLGWISVVRSDVERSTRWLDVARVLRTVGVSAIGRVGDGPLAGAWLAASAVFALVFVLVHRRLARARDAWPRAELHGVAIRLSPRLGPAAVGLVRPEVVLPAWLLGRSEAEQRMAIAHESAHMRARDPQLLGAAWIALILFPWNPALWLMVARLRLAIEIDCDRRVLRQGASPRAYGSLLVAVAELASPLRPSALALADDSSHLKRRIIAMDAHLPRFVRTRTALAAVVGGIAVLAACETKEPTAADVSAMDVASAEKTAHELGVLPADTKGVAFKTEDPEYVVDSVRVSPETARRLGSGEIVTVKVRRTPNDKSEVDITTMHDYVRDDLAPRRELDTGVVAAAVRQAHGVDAVVTRGHGTESAQLYKVTADSSISWFLNDQPSDYATVRRVLSTLDRSQIESVEVLKGAAASQQYGTPLGQSVVAVRTKGGSK